MSKHFIRTFQWLALITALCLLYPACAPKEEKLDRLVVRISDDPDRLNPLIARSTVSYQIMNKIFHSLVDFDPTSLQLIPVLIKDMPQISSVDEGRYAGFFEVKMSLLPAATWEDGSSISHRDLAFTLKAILICEWYGSGPPALLNTLVACEFDEDSDKDFTFYLKDGSPFSAYNVLLMPLMPAHIYDPDDKLAEMDINEALNTGNASWLEKYPMLQTFAEDLNASVFSREIISGTGPYTFERWEDGQLIALKKKKPYWGDGYASDRPILSANPSQIFYRIIPDEISAIEALKEGSVDILGDFSPDQFFALQEISGINTYSPDVLQYYYTAINNQDEILSDLNVRKALAHLLPTDEIITELFNGLASRINGPIHPAKPYYNADLKPVTYDPLEAAKLLSEAGWSDSDGDGILDKTVDGIKKDLKISIHTSQRKLGQDLSLILQDKVAKAGIQLEINVVDNPTLLKDVTERNFQLANLASRFNPGLDELYSTWHSASISVSGNNISGFSHPEADKLIESIQSGQKSREELNQLYAAFQEIIHEHQPVLFICAPKERIAAKSSIKLPLTLMKPGYLEHLATPAIQ